MFISKVFSFFFVCILAVCGNSVSQIENVSPRQQNDKTDLSLRIKTTACFGKCPIYNLTIQPNGKTIFEGIQDTKVKGKAESNLTQEKMNALIDEIDKADFFSFKVSYEYDSGNCPVFFSDAPSIVISVALRGKEKTISHNYGCEETGGKYKIFPQQLYNLENKINEIVETKRWIGEGK